MVFTIIAVVIPLYALAVLFILPAREVTQPPGKLQTTWEVLLPGMSPSWHVFGGVALVAWCYFILQDMLLFKKGTPWMIAAIAMPNLKEAYGVPGAAVAEALKMINPTWVWVYLAPAVLFAVNLILVLRARRQV